MRVPEFGWKPVRWGVGLLVVAVLALASGCDDTAGGAGGRGGAQSSEPSPESTEDEAVSAYVSMWQDAAVASRTSDVDHPRLEDHAVDEALTLLRFVIQGHADAGHVARGGPDHDVEVVSSTPDRRELRDCLDGTKWLMHDRDGRRVGDGPGTFGRVEATVEVRAGQWVVTDLVMHGAGTC